MCELLHCLLLWVHGGQGRAGAGCGREQAQPNVHLRGMSIHSVQRTLMRHRPCKGARLNAENAIVHDVQGSALKGKPAQQRSLLYMVPQQPVHAPSVPQHIKASLHKGAPTASNSNCAQT